MSHDPSTPHPRSTEPGAAASIAAAAPEPTTMWSLRAGRIQNLQTAIADSEATLAALAIEEADESTPPARSARIRNHVAQLVSNLEIERDLLERILATTPVATTPVATTPVAATPVAATPPGDPRSSGRTSAA